MYDNDPTQAMSPLPPTPPRRGCGGCLRNVIVLSVMLIGLILFTGVVATSTILYTQFSAELDTAIERLENVDQRETFETTRIFDRNGDMLWEIFGEGKRTYIPLAQIPISVQQATIAIEDDSFYENTGADIPSLLAALIANLRNPDGRPVGASTITQQLVRHIAFDYEERTAVSYNRKAKEIILAWLMTRDYDKDKILELYLNEIYYGNLAYGIEAAAQTYFGKPAADLTLAEATFLAGLPQAPVELDPFTNFEAAKNKQWLVLNLMVSEGFLEANQTEPLFQTYLDFAPQTVSLAAPHFSIYVRQQLEEMFGAEVVANGGLRVSTSLDMRYQRLAENLAQQHVGALRDPHNLTNAALLAMNPNSGEILAMLGSVDYQDETIDGRVNVLLSPQQPGSSIKPLTYALALSPDETGTGRWSPGEVIWDVETTYRMNDGTSYTPVNYDRTYRGPVRLRDALANSYNVPAVLLLQDIGVPQFIDFVQTLGITSFGDDASQYGLSLTLGGGELTPLELTNAYAILANEGQEVAPVAILKVVNSRGEVLFEQSPNPQPAQLLDPRVAFVVSDMLSDAVARRPAMGSNSPLDLPFTAAVKTGTTNDFRDNWTMGYTPDLVVGVWAGNTDNSPMVNVSGLTGAAPLWNAYMQAVYNNYELLDVLGEGEQILSPAFAPPAGLARETLCAIPSITLGAVDCAPGRQEWVLVDEAGGNPTAVPSPNQVVWTELEPSVVRAPAVPLPPVSVELVSATQTVDPNALPPMSFCFMPEGVDTAVLPPNALPQLFLKPPRNPQSLKSAYEWGLANNIAILPTEGCNEELLALAGQMGQGTAVWRISSPTAGQQLDGVLPIIGTASFNPDQVQFYKIELGRPNPDNPNETQWLTLGETSNVPVANGQLELLYASGLPPGDYYLRLILVQWDGNYVGEPHTIPIQIVR